MAVLHIITKSSTHSQALAACTRVAKRGCGLILIQDAVYNARADFPHNQALAETLVENNVYVLMPDARARGLCSRDLAPEITQVEYPDFVDIACEYESSATWG